jgi:DNA-binding IclR family transcriptional regulator
MSTPAKVLQVLGLFLQQRKQLCVADVMGELQVSAATAYRYLGDLEQAGMIERANANQYVLGPTIVELDRQIRLNDPLIAAAAEVMKKLSDRTGGTALLSRWHGRKVVCVHQTLGRLAPPAVSYERGRAMPLYAGATSKVILAQLDPAQLRDIVLTDAPALRKAGLPTSFEALSSRLAALRADTVCHAAGEVDPGAMAWAVPIRHGKALLGSLSVVMDRRAPVTDREGIANQVLRAGLRIEGRLELPARSTRTKR